MSQKRKNDDSIQAISLLGNSIKNPLLDEERGSTGLPNTNNDSDVTTFLLRQPGGEADGEGGNEPINRKVEFTGVLDDPVHYSIKETYSTSAKLLTHSTRISSKYHPTQPSNSPTVTIFLLLNAMLGSGMLNQPKVFASSGILGALLGYIIATLASWYGLIVLTAAGLHTNLLEYSSLAYEAYGKYGEKTVDFSNFIVCYASLLSYTIIICFTTADLLKSWGCPSNICSDLLTLLIISGIFLVPPCFMRHFGHFGIISIFSFLATVGVALLVWVFGPYQHFQEKDKYDVTYKLFDFQGLFSSLGSIIFALSVTYGNFHAFVSTEKEFQTLSNWNVITGIVVSSGSLICFSMGLIGYLSFGSDTNGNILDNFTQHGYDFFKLLMVIHLIMSFPVVFVVGRYSFVKLMTGRKSEELEFWSHVFFTIGILIASIGMVLLLASVGYTSGNGSNTKTAPFD